MKVYLDNAATTRPYKTVVDKMNKVLEEDYGNPSSMHTKGYDAEKYIKESREIISKNLKVDPKEIFFTSGGTESNNTALIGCALANKRRGMHIISTRIEHASVYNPLLFLEEMGFEIEFLEVDNLVVRNSTDNNTLQTLPEYWYSTNNIINSASYYTDDIVEETALQFTLKLKYANEFQE